MRASEADLIDGSRRWMGIRADLSVEEGESEDEERMTTLGGSSRVVGRLRYAAG